MFPYEQLEVYKKASRVNRKVYDFLKGNKSMATYVKNQLGRASLSIMLNIAEGSAKFSSRDRRNFLITARGSVFECASLVNFLYDEGEVPEALKNELYSAFDEISRILYTMIKNLEM
ncbi:MAG: four helix bundle protein [Chitinophagaceae bacterium]|nr:four helix bundle protein [Chitinophagaceae bacterium]